MAATPSKKQRDSDNDEATAIAWNNGSRHPQAEKARRVKVWLKKSVTNLTSPRDVEFENSPSSKIGSFAQRRDPARNPTPYSQKLQQQSLARRPHSTTTSSKTTATIDQAMFSLYRYTGPKKKLLGTSAVQVEPETPSSYVPNCDYDWMLDGREDWKEAEQTSTEYLRNLDEPWDMELYIKNYLQDREEKLQQELNEEEAAFHFDAEFDESGPATVDSIPHEEGPPFISAANDPEQEFHGTASERQDNKEDAEGKEDFGEFQAAENDDIADSHGAQMGSEIDNCPKTNLSALRTHENPHQAEEHDQKQPINGAPIPELSDEKYSDDVSSLGCNDSASVDMEDGSIEEKGGSEDKANESNSEGKQAQYTEPNVTEQFESTEEQVPTTLCHGVRSMPNYSPGSIGESIFACSFRDEELESTEEEIVAEAVGILESCRSTAEDTPRLKKSKTDAVKEQTKEHELRENKNIGKSDAVERAKPLSIRESTNRNQVDRYGQPVANDNKPVGGADENGTSDEDAHPSDFSALSAVNGIAGDEYCQNKSIPAKFSKPEKSESRDLGDEEESFGDFYEAPPVSSLDRSVDLGGISPEKEAFCNGGGSKDLHNSSAPQETGGLAPLDITSIENRRDATGVEATSPSLLGNVTREPRGEAFTPTFAILPPIKANQNVKSLQEAAAPFQSEQCQERRELSSKVPAHTPPDQDDIFSVGSDSSHPHSIPVSLRLRITDLSTPEARFARRQWQKYHRENKTTQQNGKLIDSSRALGDIDDDMLSYLYDDEPLTAIPDLDIPKYYFTQPDLDDTVRVLQNAPWHHIAHLWKESEGDGDGFGGLRIASSSSFDDQHDRRALWEEYLTGELCRLDSAKNQVSRHLLRRIRPHAPTLNVANRSIHEFGTSLHLAQMYLERSQAAVRQAARGTYDHKQQRFNCFDGWNGANELLKAWDQQALYRKIQATLNQVQDILDTERSLQKQVENFTFNKKSQREYFSLICQVDQLRTSVLSNDDFARLDAIADLRERLRKKSLLLDFHSRLHTLAESVAVRCCRRRQLIQQQEYQTLLEAAFLVRETTNPCEISQHSGETLSQSDVKKERPSHTALVPSDLLSTWPQTLMEALCYEANRALAAALLDPLLLARDGNTSIDSEYERELTGLAYDMQQDWGDAAKLRTICHNLIIIRFDWESSNYYLLPVYHRLCITLADVLHTHHTIGQWQWQMLKEYERRAQNNVEDEKEEKCEVVDDQNYHNHHSKLHEPDPSNCIPLLKEIQTAWLKSREDLWKCCEDVLIKCLEEYLHFASHKNLFEKQPPRRSGSFDESDQSHDRSQRNIPASSNWRRDLENLHSVLLLTEQFVSVKDRFIEGELGSRAQIGGSLREKLCDVFRKHLRHVHVEAMKSLGMSLSQESWDMVSLKDISDLDSTSSMSLPEAMAGALSSVSETIDAEGWHLKGGLNSTLSKTRRASEGARRSLFRQQRGNAVTNPFLVPLSKAASDVQVDSSGKGNECGQGNERGQGFVDEESSREVYELIAGFLSGRDSANTFARVASKSTVKVFFSWAARLLLVMERLPLIVEDISAVFANLCDLYLTTVFRLCAGNAANERLLLGVDTPAQPVIDSNSFGPRSPEKPKPPSSPPLFGFRRKSSNGSIGGSQRRSNVTKVEIPTTLDADICAPLKSEMPGIGHTQNFIRRAQESLKDIVILDKVDHWFSDPVIVGANPEDNDKIIDQAIRNLEKRLGAVWSCLSVAALLDATCNVARKKLSSSELGQRFVGDLASFEHYTQAVFQMTPQLIRLSSRISCVRAILAKRVVLEILKVGVGWEEAKLNEQPNEYVEALCRRCALIWAALQATKRGLPAGVIKMSWEHMIRGGFATLLEGFSKVPFCSTEGRALMSMDLASFSAGVSPSSVLERLQYDVHYEAPPAVNTQGMRYLDTYIKVFYYPREDVMEWIRENYKNYKLSHCLTLAANAFRTPDGTGDDSNSIPVEVALEAVRNIYQVETSSKGAD